MNFVLISLLISFSAFVLQIHSSDSEIPIEAYTKNSQLKSKFKIKTLKSGSDNLKGTQEAQEKFNLMHKKLRSFTSGNYFDSQSFSSQIEQLDGEIQDLVVSSEGLSSRRSDISKQVSFIALMFEKMKFGAQVLQFYSKMRPKENHWIKIVTRTNLYLFSLYDSYGNLDVQVKNLEQILSAIWKDLQILDYSFDEIIGTSESARQFFVEQLSQARQTCYALVRKLVERKFDM